MQLLIRLQSDLSRSQKIDRRDRRDAKGCKYTLWYVCEGMLCILLTESPALGLGLMLSLIRGCKYDFEAVTMVTPGYHGILLVPNLLL